MRIRSARKEDLPACAEIFTIPEVREANGEYLTPEFLVNYLDTNYFLVAEVAGQVRGALFGEPLRCRGLMVLNFAVEEEYRDQGLGSALLRKFEANARADKRAWILVYAPLANKRTLNFYEKHTYLKGDGMVEYLKLINQPDLKSICRPK